ncbi:signal peptidase II [Rhodovibrio salinarum]|uniref:Lipoprotein signal peptidase n=1 Tax=Rhodovibrio salinarum TaxID=1087 RepID=A0A934V2Y5_9PROT|nr:signal peptidase II [Rhodovibrio salinarum]MBK1699191.1 signal peptidase II [Rhodovibrio salinarum]
MFRFGLVMAAVVLVADQVSKLWILDLMQPPRRIEVTGFFNLVLVWNPGVSFGLLGAGNPWQPWLLSAFATIVAGGLLYWLHTGRHGRWTALAIGLIVGGAIGNVIDRLRFGAVVDFLDVHAAGWHWPAFNVADSAIVVGVGVLLLDAFLRRDRESA